MRASLMEREEELQSEIGLMEVRNCARKGMGPDCLTPATTTLSPSHWQSELWQPELWQPKLWQPDPSASSH